MNNTLMTAVLPHRTLTPVDPHSLAASSPPRRDRALLAWIIRGLALTLGVGLLFPNQPAFAVAEVQPLYSFGASGQLSGTRPDGRILIGSDDFLYGTAWEEGAHGGGTIFKIAKDGTGYVVLHNFGSIANDGIKPQAGLLEGSDGALYGSCSRGGDQTAPVNFRRDAGTLFRINKDGSGYSVIYRFGNDGGSGPRGRLVEDVDGTLFGCTDGGSGTIFRIQKNGTGFAVLHSLAPGNQTGFQPQAELLLGSDGALYGTAKFGPANGEAGTVFRVETNGSNFQVLHQFSQTPDGAHPSAGLIEVADGADSFLYGTTWYGGAHGRGTIFRLRKYGTDTDYAVVHSFAANDSEGSEPTAELTQGVDGYLYGTTASFWGSVYRLNADGTGFTVIKRFQSSTDPGTLNAAVVQDTDGQLYGTANLGRGVVKGSVFKLAADGSALTVLKEFLLGGGDGAAPGTPLVIENGDTLFGVAPFGNHSKGVIYRLNVDGTGYGILHHFGSLANDGGTPNGSLRKASDGALYGVCLGGEGSAYFGTIYRIQPDGTGYETVLNLGGLIASPTGELLEKDAVLFGTAWQGGSWRTSGVVYKVNLDGTDLTLLHEFGDPSGDGSMPSGGLLEGTDGFLYGTTIFGGAHGLGTLFRLSLDGLTYQLLHSFDGVNDGAFPLGTLYEGPDGLLYGTTTQGGGVDQWGNLLGGTVFRVARNGTAFELLHLFGEPGGARYPRSGLVPFENNVMLGTADSGAVFRINRDGTDYRLVATQPFAPGPTFYDNSMSSLVKDADGAYYGVLGGGGNHSLGFVYRLSLVNSSPVANPLAGSVAQTLPLALTLTGTDPEQDPLTYRIIDAPAHGTLSGTPPNVTYTSTADYLGVDSFTFVVNDGTVDSPAATVTIDVRPLNHPPTATSVTLTVAEDGWVEFQLAGADVDGDPLVFTSIAGPNNAYLWGDVNGGLVYQPFPEFSGADSYTFEVSDGRGGTASGTVSFTVTAVQDPPVAQSASLEAYEGMPLSFTLLATDVENDPITFSVLTPPTHGTLTGSPPNLTYTPAVGYLGLDSLTFTASDGQGGTGTGTVSIEVVVAPAGSSRVFTGLTSIATIGLGVDSAGNTYALANDAATGSMLITKLDPAGTQLWNTPYGPPEPATGRGIAVDPNGNVYIVGFYSYLHPDGYYAGERLVIKLSPDGNVVWARRGNLAGVPSETPAAVQVDPAGNIVLLSDCYDANSNPASEAAVVKLDADGNTLWSHRRPGDVLRVLTLDAAGQIFGGGMRGADVIGVKYAVDGQELWTGICTDPWWFESRVYGIAVDPAGSLHLAGATRYGWTDLEVLTVKFDANGQLLWANSYDNGAGATDIGRSVAVDSLGHVHVTGTAYGVQFFATAEWLYTIAQLDADAIGWGAEALTLTYDATGQLLSSRLGFGNHGESSYGLAVGIDSLGREHVSGTRYAYGPPISPGVASAAYDANGALLWKGQYRSSDLTLIQATAHVVGAGGQVQLLATATDNTSPFGLLVRFAQPLALTDISPSSAEANRPDALTLTVNGYHFDDQTVLFWNGSARPTTRISPQQLSATIPTSDFQVTGDIVPVLVTVSNVLAGVGAGPVAFAITRPNVSAVDVTPAPPGEVVSVTTVPTTPTESGVSATLDNSDAGAPATVAVARYESDPTPAGSTAFETAGDFLDLQVTSPSPESKLTAQFYYPASIQPGPEEDALVLKFYTGSGWPDVVSSPGIPPAKNLTDNLDGTVSGGRFTVVFDESSTPKLSELGGTYFAVAVNTAPGAIPQALIVVEDTPITISLSGIDAELDPLAFGIISGPTHGNLAGNGSTVVYAPAPGFVGTDTFTFVADDGKVTSQPAVVTLTVVPRNVTPAITAVTGPMGPLAVDTGAALTVAFTDADPGDTHTVRFSWDDGTPDTVLNVSAPGATANHMYGDAGVYTVTVTVTDAEGAEATSKFEYVVVYDPTAGYVTGLGWLQSPAGAYAPEPDMTGTALFGFVSRYKRGISVPIGVTEFYVHAARFNFFSSTYEWLVVAGPKAQYRGTGKINGQGSYGFILTATDGQLPLGGGQDRLRLKIWDKTTGQVIYDNRRGASDDMDAANPQVIGGGSIVIQKSR